MRGVICYYSASGNTRLASRYVAARLDMECDLVDVSSSATTDLSAYDFVGFAAPTDFGGMPQRFETFLAELPQQSGKPAFVFNSYGLMSGRTLADLAEQASARGLRVLAGHSLRMPENYPPMRAIRLPFDNRPNAKDVRRLDAFIAELRRALEALGRGAAPDAHPVRLGLLGGLRSAKARTTARDDMGEKFVDAQLCTECGTCVRKCPYGAIVLDPMPVVDMSACHGCWRCFNQCPEHAIYTARFRGGPFYARPSEHARQALRP